MSRPKAITAGFQPTQVFCKSRSRVVLTLLLCLLSLFFKQEASATPVAPTDNTSAPYMGLYGWGLDSSSPPSGMAHIAATSSWLNRSGLWAEDFLPTDNWTDLEGYWGTLRAQLWLHNNPGATYICTVGMLPSGSTLADGAAGTFNAHFTALAQNIVNNGLANNIIVRLGHEFNGGWYAWSATTDAAALNYAAYWRQIVNTMRAVPGAANIKFCWNGTNVWTSYSVADAYPGDAYVDYIAVDLYDSSWATNTYPYPSGATAAQILTCQQNAWAANSGTANNGLAAWKSMAVAHGKPLAIPEWGCSLQTDTHGGLDDPYYVQQMYNFIQDPANNVAFHVYFDVEASDGHHQMTQLPGGTATEFPNSAALFKKLFGVNAFPVNSDIGTVGVAGSSDPVTVSGAGAGYLTGTSDNFHYAARTSTGNDSLVAEVTSISAATTGQSGLMLRQSSAANAPYAAVFIANGQCVFQSRTVAGATAVKNSVISSINAPVWLKMMRLGNAITAYESPDGRNWTYAGGETVAMTSPAYLGVAVSSGNTTALNATGLDNIDGYDIPAIDPGITNEIIVDSAATTGVTKTGSWSVSTGDAAYEYGGSILTAWTPTTPTSITFTPTLPQAGQYDVYLRWYCESEYQFADNMNVIVTSASGTVTQTVNQKVGNYLWVYMGTYNFAAGTAGSIALNNTGADGYVSVDGAMFVPVPAPALPVGQTDADIGSPSPAGSAAYSVGIYTLKGGGADIWGTADQFNFLSQNLTGDQSLVVRVTSLTNTSASAKTGLMFRDSTASNAMFALLDIKPGGGLEFNIRSSTGGSAVYNSGAAAVVPTATTPVWLKLTKSGTSYTAYYSTSVSTPTTWTTIGSATVSLANSTYLAGLATVSHLNGTLTTATADNYTIAAPSIPGCVGTVTQGTTTTSSISFSWLPVSGATSYDIGYQTSGTGWASVSTTGTSYTLTGLLSGSWYWIQVRGTNASGSGAWTGVYSFKTN